MTQDYQGSAQITINSTYTNVQDLSSAVDTLNITAAQAWTYGTTGQDKASAHWSDQVSLATSNSVTYDLTALTGGFGILNFSAITGIYIRVETDTTAYYVEVGGAGTNEWAGTSQMLKATGDVIRLQSGGAMLITAPDTGWVVDATHKMLKINNPSAGAVVVDLAIVGVATLA